jgi:hypothetical protein
LPPSLIEENAAIKQDGFCQGLIRVLRSRGRVAGGSSRCPGRM